MFILMGRVKKVIPTKYTDQSSLKIVVNNDNQNYTTYTSPALTNNCNVTVDDYVGLRGKIHTNGPDIFLYVEKITIINKANKGE